MQMNTLGKMACFMFSLCVWTPHLHVFMFKLWHIIFTRHKGGYCEDINTVILTPAVSLDYQHERSFEMLSVGDAAWGLVLEPGLARIQSIPLQLHSVWDCLDARLRTVMEGSMKPSSKLPPCYGHWPTPCKCTNFSGVVPFILYKNSTN